ncbi:hypothetical protein QJ856_gp0391 [Tupanvirus deep ocean]|uniref:Uncharacterized protein n=2 Tax=Tupanvirus TaxID=2094720 RepID=A0AC62A9J6_9VIRU|nr:hypothetical protein QJ856_gp0391 [Tupanvirus deep ocean]QKU34347.1 hypothetical protein [Tupanvirus deep ocean]
MTELNFTDFSDYDNKFHCYLVKNNLVEKVKMLQLAGIKEMVNKFDMFSHEDVNQLAFLMWMLIKYFKTLLNDGYLLEKIDLDFFEKQITNVIPELNITGFSGCTPLGGPRGHSSDSLPYYDCIKFIGQYTRQQDIYDKCLKILEALPIKLKGPILDPPEVLYLMQYNKHVDTSKNKHKQKVRPMNKIHSFKYSIYQPNPSHQRQYDRYKKDIQQAYYDVALNVDPVGMVCLTNQLVHTHYHVIKDTNNIRFLSKININNTAYQSIAQILREINEQTVIINENQNSQKKFNRIKKIINKTLRFISKDDESEIWDIFINAFIYVSDKDYDKEILKRDMMIELYERGLVDPNSKLSHNLMRNAADNGILWIIKYLISKGCITKNLPEYGSWKWDLESRQLKDILEKEVKDYHNYGKKWVQEKTKAKLNVYNYLVQNNYI